MFVLTSPQQTFHTPQYVTAQPTHLHEKFLLTTYHPRMAKYPFYRTLNLNCYYLSRCFFSPQTTISIRFGLKVNQYLTKTLNNRPSVAVEFIVDGKADEQFLS